MVIAHGGILPSTPTALLLECRSWEDLRGWLAEAPAKFKGDCFELLTEQYLRLAPKYQTQLKHVWRLPQVPAPVAERLRLPHQDEGIDLVAETLDGGFWAVQCKYRQDEEHSTTFREVSTFLALRADRGFELALLCTTADSYSGKLKSHDKLQFCAGDEWRALDAEFFEQLHRVLKGKAPKPPSPFSPRRHQKRAVADAEKYFGGGESRGKLIMPCGTGKSLAAFWIAERLGAKRVLVAVPSLALVRQMLNVWAREYLAIGHRPSWVAVCSDETLAKPLSDDPDPQIQDLGVAVHTDPNTVAAWLRTHRADDRTIVFTTYQSGRATAEAARKAGLAFDLGVFDEAHKTAGRKAGVFAHLLHERNVKVAKRLFMTATERRYIGDSDDIVSMDDETIYGGTLHKLTFKAALKAKVLCDYQVLLVECLRKDIEALVRDRQFVLPKGEHWDFEVEADTLAAAVALRKTMSKYPVRHALSFHSSVARARRFKALQEAFTTAFRQHGDLEVFHVSGKTPTAVRSRELKRFEMADRGLVTNARCLTEGVDIPAIDGILFADPRQSVIDIVQAVGRAMRPYSSSAHGAKELGYVVVPVLLDEGEDKPSDDAFAAVLRVLTALAENDERIVEYFRTISQGKTWSGRKPYEADIAVGLTIDEKAFEAAIDLRVWERLAKLNWRPFNKARAYVRKLGLGSWAEWQAWSKSGMRPPDIPAAPSVVYANDFVSLPDWLGCRPRKGADFIPFIEARAFMHKLGLGSLGEWRTWSKSGKRPQYIPSSPEKIYRETFDTWPDWVGYSPSHGRGNKLPFGEARAYARSLGFHSSAEWHVWAKSGKRPLNVPSNPERVYEKEFDGWPHWLGYAPRSERGSKLPFNEARTFVRKLGLSSQKEWRNWAKSSKRPLNIPNDPNVGYPDEFDGFPNWLGYAPKQGSDFLPFAKARAYVRKFGLSSQAEWSDWKKGGKRPLNIPSHPGQVYKKEYRNLPDWLGFRPTREFGNKLPFKKARAFVRALGFRSWREWAAWSKSGKRPLNIPSSPSEVYKKEYTSVPDWLGFRPTREFGNKLPFRKARAFVRALGFQSEREWRAWSKSGNRPTNIPGHPTVVYRKEFKGWPNWLGYAPKQGSDFLPFAKARAYVRKFGLSSQAEWSDWKKGGKRPLDIPSHPHEIYKNEFKGWPDWLGYEPKRQLGNKMPFNEARAYVRKLGLGSSAEWRAWSKSGKLPLNIPSTPEKAYPNEYRGSRDWLGDGPVRRSTNATGASS